MKDNCYVQTAFLQVKRIGSMDREVSKRFLDALICIATIDEE